MPFKTEGTSITWGQSISETGVVGNINLFQTAQSAVAGLNTTSIASVTRIVSPQVPAPSVVEESNTPDNSEPSENIVPVVPVDTVVEVIRNTSAGSVGSSLGSKSASDISMAAASSNNAIAVVDDDFFLEALPQSLQGQILANVSTISPKTSTTVVVAGSAVNTRDEIKKALVESQKIDLSIVLKSKKSEKVEFNNVKRPVLEADFVYNYFTKNEEDVEVQEDQARDPLLKRRPVDVPRYVSLHWDITEVTAPLRGTEEVSKKNAKLKRAVFTRPGGTFGVVSTRVPFSVEQQTKNKQPYVQGGTNKVVVDIHKPDVVFSGISNNQVFPNSVSVKINTNKQRAVISDIPSFQVK